MRLEVRLEAYARPNYWEQTLASWSQVRGIDDVSVTVHLEPSNRAPEMTRLQRAHLPQANLKLNKTRYGVQSHPWQIYHQAFSAGAQFVVIGEDDVVVSTDTLEYFRWAADRFEGDKSVLGVCGYSRQSDIMLNPNDVVLRSDFGAMLWGTWADRWHEEFEHTWDHDYSSGRPTGTPSGFDWNINLRVVRDRKFVWPLQSRCNHIGREQGSHTTAQTFPGSQALTFVQQRPQNSYSLQDGGLLDAGHIDSRCHTGS